MRGSKVPNQLRKNRQCSGSNKAEPYRPEQSSRRIARDLLGAPRLSEDRPCPWHKRGAGGRQAHPTPVTLEELRAKLSLKALNAPAQRRLGHAEAGCRATEV